MSENTESSSKRSLLRRIGLMGAVVMLVTTGALTPVLGPGSSPVQQAEASHTCDQVDNIVAWLVPDRVSTAGSSAYSYDTNVNERCSENHVDDAVEQMDEQDANQTKTDIYTAANAQKAQLSNNLVTKSNYLQTTRGAVWMEVQNAVAKAAINNRTKAEAEQMAKDAIEDYYSRQQLNLLDSWDVAVTTHETLRNRSVSEDGISKNYVTVYDAQGVDGYGTRTVTLANGTQVSTKSIIEVNSEDPGITSHHTPVKPGYSSSLDMVVKPPSSDYEPVTLASVDKYHSLWTEMETQSTTLQNESEVFIDGTWQALDSGKIDPADLRSRINMMWGYGTDAVNSSGTYNTIASLAAIGLETPNLNNSGYMTVEYGGKTVEGQIVGDAPGNTWRSGMTYDISTFTQPVQMADLNGSVETIKSDFTITKITDKSGNEIQSIKTSETTYKTSNTTEQQRLMEEMTELRNQIEKRDINVTVKGGSTDDDGGPLSGIGPAKIAAIAVLLIGVALLLQQTGD